MVGRELNLSFVCALFLSLQLIGMLQTPHRIALRRTSIPYKIFEVRMWAAAAEL